MAARFAAPSFRETVPVIARVVSRMVTWGMAGLLAGAVATAFAATTPAPKNVPAPKKEEGFQTSATAAILIDADGDSVLFEKNADELLAPASLAKLMTAEVVFNELKTGKLKLDDEFVVSDNAWRRGGAPSHTSSMFAPIHSRVRVDDLLHSVIIQSGNDACITLAEGISGSEQAFAAKMTQRARDLGLTKSVFTNSTGLPDPGLKVTTRELARLAQHIIATYPEFYSLYSEKEFTWNKIRQQNRNPLLAMNIGADGMKTGFTEEAGYSLVGSAIQNGVRLIVVTKGAKSDKERADEAKKLLEWGFHSFESRILFAEGQTVADAKLYGGAKGSVPLVAARPVRLMVPRGVSEKIVARVSYQGPIQVPVRQGQPIGTLKVWRNDNLSLEVPLRAAEDVGPGNLPRRAFDAASELVINLFRAGIQRL
jgi:D-alanyl-D-alanine carboxypeptidase (penicillin-binding protein 5/6)